MTKQVSVENATKARLDKALKQLNALSKKSPAVIDQGRTMKLDSMVDAMLNAHLDTLIRSKQLSNL